MTASRPLGVRLPSFVVRAPEQAESVLSALRALYRDYLANALDSQREESVDIADPDPPKEDC